MTEHQWQSVHGSEDFIAGERSWQREQDEREHKRKQEAVKRADQIARDKREHRTERLGYLAVVTGVLGAIGIVAWLIWALVGRNMDSEVAKHTACYESGGTMSVVNGSRVCVERPSTGEVPQ